MSCTTCKKTKRDRVSDVVKAAIVNPVSIAKAWYHVVVKNEDIEAFAQKRLQACGTCKDKVLVAKVKNKEVWICNDCSCPIEGKARDYKQTCPNHKW